METKKEIADCVSLLGCCSRCLLRYLGEKNYPSYMGLDQVRKTIWEMCGMAEDEATTPKKRQNCGPCIACLGLLQEGCETNEVAKIIATVQEMGHVFDDFLLQLSIPPSIELREHLMHLHLKDKISGYGEESVASVRETWKWVVGPQLGRECKADFNLKSNFAISVQVVHPDLQEECKPLEKASPESFPNGKRKKRHCAREVYTRTAVQKALKHLSPEKLLEMGLLPPPAPTNGCQYAQINCTHNSLYVAGRYNKYSRHLSQTPWIIDGEKKMESSVEELITDVLSQFISADKIVFSSSGREDVDVRMLGKGRPFVLEFVNPIRINFQPEEMHTMQQKVNASTQDIAVQDLQVVNKSDLQRLKEGEETKRKSYRARCCISRPLMDSDKEILSSIVDLSLQQLTPIRVLHRRPLASREKVIYKMSIEKIDSQYFYLHLLTMAGTYVKEFVHGDFGRTSPSLGSLLDAEADILELDVEDVELDWPPFINR